MAWRSPQAQRWLADYFALPDGSTDEAACLTWLKSAAPGAFVPPPRPSVVSSSQAGAVASDNRSLVARALGQVGLGETMWLLSLREPGEAASSRLATAELTPRETEVLSWIAKGKTNRDIADILGMSPRTVNKHLEHVFEKLGVETRAAAAALASREMNLQG
jgi:DNA-binding CsgD family transcriptional regulator